jgi:HK97 family phage major capsid protein
MKTKFLTFMAVLIVTAAVMVLFNIDSSTVMLSAHASMDPMSTLSMAGAGFLPVLNTRLKDLREKRGKLIADARDVINRSEAAGRQILNTDDQAVYDRAMGDVVKLGDEIKREESLQAIERESASLVAAALTPGAPSSQTERVALAIRGFLVNGVITPDLRAALKVGQDSSGGFLVMPEEFVKTLLKGVDNLVHIRALATVYKLTEAKSLGVPSLETDPDDADWTTELAVGSEDSAMAFGKRALEPKPLGKLIKVSNTLLRVGSLNPEQIVNDRLAYKFGISQEKAFMTGTGAGQPLGVFTADNNGVSTSRDVSTGNTTTSITFDGLNNAKFALKAQYRNRSTTSWMFHRDGVKQIAGLKDGDGQYIWRPSVREGEPDRLLGLPYRESEYAPNTFTSGLYVGALADWSNYWIAETLQFTLQRLVELYAATNQTGFIGRAEIDGMPALEEAFVRVKLG